jgi:hypothetical protein
LGEISPKKQNDRLVDDAQQPAISLSNNVVWINGSGEQG